MRSAPIVMMFLLGLAACGDDGNPQPDARPATPDALPDARAACSMVDECPCFSNDDCPDGTRCHAASEDSVYCEPGARGTGAAGSTCTDEMDCASALCVEGTDTFRCSKTCKLDTECPSELPRCLGALGICARAI